MTRRIIPLPRDPHKDLQALLPWYAAGRLSAGERADVEAHLASCAACRVELRDEPGLAAEIANLPLSDAPPSLEHGWAVMSRRLEREAPRRASFSAWTRSLLPSESGRSQDIWLRWAVAAQFCALLAMGVAIWRPAAPLMRSQARYHTLSSAPEPEAANLVVVFRPNTPERALREILRASDARLVGGPTEADAYLLQVPAAARVKALARLRREARVVLAEPVDAG
jgi:hypothetical protein